MMTEGTFELHPGDALYPETVLELSDVPQTLYVRGNPEVLSTPALSVIGARKASPYGLAVAELAAKVAVEAGVTVVSGGAVGQFYGVINPYIGFMAGMKAFTAAVLGGIGSIPGAMIGGLILGIAEALSSAYLSTEYKDVVSFALLILVLLVMPTGILGRPEVEKV